MGTIEREAMGWLLTAAVVWLGAGACGGGDAGSDGEGTAGGAVEVAAATSEEAEGRSAGSSSGGEAELLSGLPDTCPLLGAEEASELLGAPAATPEGVPNEGRAGSLCRYLADREHRLGFELFMLPLAVWDPATGSLEELAALSEQTRSSGPESRVWEDGPGLGGYYAEEETATTAWIVTPYGFTPGMGDEASSQVYLRVYIEVPRSAEARLAGLRTAAESIIPRMNGG